MSPLPFPTIFASWPQYLITALVLLVAQTVYVLFGFGAGLIAVGTLAVFLRDLKDVVVMMMLISLPPELLVVVSSRRHISWVGVGLICAGMVLGVPLGTAALDRGDPTMVLLLLGLFLVGVGLVFLLLPARAGRGIRWPAWSAPLVGVLAGALGGMFGTAGPPIILYYRLAGMQKGAFRGNLMAIFMLLALYRLPIYALSGLITGERLWSALAVLPAMVLGATLGNRIHLNLPEQTFQRLVAAALAVVGVLLLLR